MQIKTPNSNHSNHEEAIWYLLSLLIIPFGNVAFGLVFSLIFYVVKFLVSKIPEQRYDKRSLIFVLFFFHLFFSISNIALFITVFFSAPLSLNKEQQARTIFTILTIVLTLIQSARLLKQTLNKKEPV